jgi:hypothetical protein
MPAITTLPNASQPVVAGMRRVTLDKIDGRWLISQFDPI